MEKRCWFRASCGATLELVEGHKLKDACPRPDVVAAELAVLTPICEGCTFDARATTGTEKEPTMPESEANQGAPSAEAVPPAQEAAQPIANPTPDQPQAGSVPAPPGMSQALNLPTPPGLSTSQPEPTSQPAAAAEGQAALNAAMAPSPASPVATPQPAPEQVPAAQPAAPQQPAAPAFGTPEASGSGNLLGQMLLGVGGEELVDVNAAIDAIDGIEGGPSRGGISWHTLEPATQCWRKAYWSLVRGLVPKQTSRALAFGSLFHACWELWYRFGGQRRYDEPCDVVRQAGAPKLAGEVQRLVYTELQRYAQEEADTWDIRGVETNAIFWMPPERINGKLVHIPATCRHDLILAKRDPGAACAPPGPAPQGVYVYDHKTASALTYDMTKGYGMDPQFLTNALVFMKSDEPEKFGKLNGVIIGVAAKHKEPSDRSFFRIETTVDEGAIEEFYLTEFRPTAIELYRRLSDKAWRDDKSRWPKNHGQCVGRYGCCKFFDLCDVGGESVMDGMFKVDESRILNLEAFAEPPAEVKRASKAADPKGAAAADARKQKAEERNRLKDLLLSVFSASLQTMELFHPSGYLVPNHTERGVLNQLVDTLKKAWVTEAGEYPEPYEYGPDAEGNFYVMTIGEKSIKWLLKVPEPVEEPPTDGKKKKKAKKPAAMRGTLSYKAVAEAICKDWWDLSNLEQNQIR